MERVAELKQILLDVGPENIRRPIYDNGNSLLSKGIADERDGRPEDIAKVDFHGKTVVDLGCNFGTYTLLAKQLGATDVLGVDWEERVIKGAELIRDMRGLEGVRYSTADFTSPTFMGAFDIVMLIDFIGKDNLTQGIDTILAAAERLSTSNMIISARPYYELAKHFGEEIEKIKAYYPREFLKDGRFHLLDYVRDFFRSGWRSSIISPRDDFYSIKRTILFTRA